MKICLTFLALCLAAVNGASLSYLVAPTLRSYPFAYGSHTSSYVTPVQQQYHTQDELGQYAYGYSDPLSTKQEVRSLDGTTRGSYSYRDANDILQTVDYHADDTGFHVQATNLPKSVAAPAQETFRTSEPSISHSVSSTADTTNTISSSDTDTEQITSADTFGKTIYSTNGLRLAESSAAHTKSASDSAHVRSLELSQPLANTIKVASSPANTIFVSEHQPRKLYFTSPVTVPKVYTYGYPLTKHFYTTYY